MRWWITLSITHSHGVSALVPSATINSCLSSALGPERDAVLGPDSGLGFDVREKICHSSCVCHNWSFDRCTTSQMPCTQRYLKMPACFSMVIRTFRYVQRILCLHGIRLPDSICDTCTYKQKLVWVYRIPFQKWFVIEFSVARISYIFATQIQKQETQVSTFDIALSWNVYWYQYN